MKKITQKLKTWECRIEKHIKKPLWRHQIKIFKIWEKYHLKFLLRSCGSSFIKIDQELWKWEAVTDRQTDTHWRSDGVPPGSTYSVLKWLNIKTRAICAHLFAFDSSQSIYFNLFVINVLWFYFCVRLLTTMSDETLPKWTHISLVVRVCVSAY